MDLDTRHLRAFVAVCDEGTFTDAAIVLGTTQASVSRSVQRLESVLGVRLMHRSARGVELTGVGRAALVEARRVLAGTDRLVGLATDGPDRAARLRLGYAWAALGEHTVTVQRGWDGARGELELLSANTPTAGLLEGRCDVAILRLPTTADVDPRLASTVVGQEPRYAAVAADDPLADRASVRLADLAGRRVATDAVSGSTRADLWPAGTAVTIVPSTGVEDWLTTIAAGRAVGVTPVATTVQHPRGGVVYRPLVDAEAVDVRLAWWADDPPPALARLLSAVRAAYVG